MGILTVYQVNFYIKSILDEDEKISDIFICGEISNFKCQYKSGHCYFVLKDERSTIRCVMFKSYASMIKFDPADGMKVIVRGKVGLYEATGQYQIYVYDIAEYGVGSYELALEELKSKLKGLGYFDIERKKRIPDYPEKIGIITGNDSAALKDMLSIAERRFPIVDIYLYPVSVQGKTSADEIIKGIRYFDSEESVDFIIIARGGGSKEDLQPFNEENLAHAIYNCTVPVVSGVGHESDVTICDLVADLRASTPSVAMELCLPNKDEILDRLDFFKNELRVSAEKNISMKASALDSLKLYLSSKSPESLLTNIEFKLKDLSIRLESATKKKIGDLKALLDEYGYILKSKDPKESFKNGHMLATYEEGTILRDVASVEVGQQIRLVTSDGYIDCEVKDKKII